MGFIEAIQDAFDLKLKHIPAPDYISEPAISIHTLTYDTLLKTNTLVLEAFEKTQLFLQEQLDDLEWLKISNIIVLGSIMATAMILDIAAFVLFIFVLTIYLPTLSIPLGILLVLGAFAVLLLAWTIVAFVCTTPLDPLLQNDKKIDCCIVMYEKNVTFWDQWKDKVIVNSLFEKCVPKEKFDQFFSQIEEINNYPKNDTLLEVKVEELRAHFETEEAITNAVQEWKKSPTSIPVIETIFQKFKNDIYFSNIFFYKDVCNHIITCYDSHSSKDYLYFNLWADIISSNLFIEEDDEIAKLRDSLRV